MKTLNRILLSRPAFYVTCLLKGLYGLMAVGVAVMLNVVVEAVSSAESAQAIITIGIAAFVFILADALCRAASEVSNSKYAVKAVGSLRSRMMESIFSMNMKEFSELDSGDYINRTTTDLSLIQEQYVVQIPNIVCYVTQFFGCVAYSIYLNPVVALMLLIISAVQYLVPMAYGKIINNKMAAMSAENGHLTSKINEWYLRDCSRKVSAAYQTKGRAGKPTTNHAIYGYRKDPEDKGHWLVDEEATAVVRRIYQLAVCGKGYVEIARMLRDDRIETPAYYLARLNGWKVNSCSDEKHTYDWNPATIGRLIARPEYKGHTVNFRTSKKSYKDKRVKKRPGGLAYFREHPRGHC